MRCGQATAVVSAAAAVEFRVAVRSKSPPPFHSLSLSLVRSRLLRFVGLQLLERLPGLPELVPGGLRNLRALRPREPVPPGSEPTNGSINEPHRTIAQPACRPARRPAVAVLFFFVVVVVGCLLIVCGALVAGGGVERRGARGAVL